jgi:molecular chaperone GrpE
MCAKRTDASDVDRVAGLDASRTASGERPDVADEVASLHNALEEEKQRNLRLRADFDNLRKRAAREGLAAEAEGRRRALRVILPVIDAFERALAAGSSDAAFYDGVRSTHRLLLAALTEAGAEPIEALGRPFDPRVHDAISYEPSAMDEPGTVMRELRRGWRLGNELIRPAEVVVAAPLPNVVE